jgi:hypothetical protein
VQLSVVQGLLSLQTLAVPAQLPPLHVSVRVHGLASSHTAVLLLDAHLPPVQLSVVHGLPSLQSPTTEQLPPQPTIA